MNTARISKIKNLHSEASCQSVRQMYNQLKNLEKTMKLYSLNDSLYFIQLTQKCFENEVAKELQVNQ